MRCAGVDGRGFQHGPPERGDGLAQTSLDVVVRGLQLPRGAAVGDVVAAWVVLHLLKGQEVLHRRVGPGQVHAARAGLGDRINKLDAEAQQLERLARSQHKASSPTVAAADVIEKIGGLIDDMGGIMNGPERDAVRLKETLRALIDEVVVSPAPDPGKPDGRGNAPVSIKVTGSLTAMVDYCEGRIIQRRGTNPATVDDAIVRYTVYTGLAPSRCSDFEADIPVWSGMLDDADVPLTLAALTDALEHLAHYADEEARKSRDRRARRLLDYFLAQPLVGCVH